MILPHVIANTKPENHLVILARAITGSNVVYSFSFTITIVFVFLLDRR